jgi:hypothetical protein
MMTNRLIIIALFFSATTPLLAQKTNGNDLYVASVIVNLLRKNTFVLPKNRSIISQMSFSRFSGRRFTPYTEESPFEKIDLQLDKKPTVGILDFPMSLVINSHKKSNANGHTVVKYLSLFGHFDTDRGAGGGLTMTY